MPGRNRGFTLIEMLVALTLLAITLTLLFSSLAVIERSWQAGEQRMQSTAERLAAQNFLRAKLADAQPYYLPGAGNEGLIAFRGDRASLEFVSLLPVASGRPGPYRFRLFLQGVADAPPRLVLAVRPFYAEAADTAITDRTILLDAVRQLQIRYFGVDVNGLSATPQWRENWQDQAELPKLVRIDVQPTIGPAWPLLLVALRVSASALDSLIFLDVEDLDNPDDEDLIPFEESIR